MIGVLTIAVLAATPVRPPALIDATQVVPGLILDLRYATRHNFLGRRMYSEARCLLRPDVANRLAQVQSNLRKEGLGLKVFDCYRPLSIQRAMWKIKPVKGYVADPATGSNHNRGGAVDVALVDREGRPLKMPTDFDSFEHAAHQGAVVDPEAAHNRDRLKAAMEAAGFRPIKMEWWHFDAPNAGHYPVLDLPLDGVDAQSAAPPSPASAAGEPESKVPASSK
jgi:zinc D-Ala-D-Ala dipeptidase